jgi:diaminopimelate decarboxylase
VLAHCTQKPRWVLVDVTTADGRVAEGVLECAGLRLIGLHLRMESSSPTADCYAAAVGQLIAQMAHLRRQIGVLLTRVSVAGAGALSPSPLTSRSLVALDAAIEDAIDDACARHRFPRPVLVLAPVR